MATATKKIATVGFHGDDHGTARETFQGYAESHLLRSYEATANHTSKLISTGQKIRFLVLMGRAIMSYFEGVAYIISHSRSNILYEMKCLKFKVGKYYIPIIPIMANLNP